jgi:hypothetical protein
MWSRAGICSAVMLTVAMLVGSGAAQARVTVTANELVQRSHVREVAAGTEVVWTDPHFERVWFPSSPVDLTWVSSYRTTACSSWSRS